MHTHRGQKKASNPTELEVQEIMRHLTWVLETGLGSPGRAASTVNHFAKSPTSSDKLLLNFQNPSRSWTRTHVYESVQLDASTRLMQGRHG